MPQKGFLRRETEKWAFFLVCKCHEPGLSTHECLNIMCSALQLRRKRAVLKDSCLVIAKKLMGLAQNQEKND